MKPEPHHVSSDWHEGQTEFSLPDEPRVLATLTQKLSCPLCHWEALLFRLPNVFGQERHGFQVMCSHSSALYWIPQIAWYCQQSPVPDQPARSSEVAMAAWKVYVALSKNQ